MGESTLSMMNLVPSYARGLDILVVHDDKMALTYLELLLQQYSFKVTGVDLASKALSLIRNQPGHFKLVMAKFNMPDMDSLSFLNQLLQTDIPITFISTGGYDDVSWKALAEGCYFLKEPISSLDLKYMWQHVFHRRFEPREFQNANCEDETKRWGRNFKIVGANEKKRGFDETEDNQKEESLKLNLSQSARTRQPTNNNGCAGKRSRPNIWTQDLHRKFTEAVSALGEKNVRPKLLLEKMNEPHLKLRQVASHLQYYKSQLQRAQKACKSDSPSTSNSSNSRARTKFPKSFQTQNNQGNWAHVGSSSGLRGLTASTASRDKNQNHNQFPVNVAASQGDDNFIQKPETLRNATFQHESLMGLASGGNQILDATIGNPVPVFSTNQNEPVLELQETYDSASFPQEYSTGMDCHGSQNLEAVEENSVPAASVNKNQSRLQLLETLGNAALPYKLPRELVNCESKNLDATERNPLLGAASNKYQSHLQLQENQGNRSFSYEIPTRLPNDGSQNLHTVAQTYVPAGSVHQNQSLLQSQGDATLTYELPPEWAYYGSQNVDAIGGSRSQVASVDKNQPLFQLQEHQSNAIFSNGLLTGLANYGNEDLFFIVQNHMSAGSVYQNQSLLQP